MERYLATLDHEELLVRRGTRSGLFTMVAVHSTARGPALGGCRMWSYDDTRAAMRDVLRLSQAMTYKSAVCGLRLGGGKGVIVLPETRRISPARRRAALLDFGDTIEALGGRYVTAEDVGTSTRDMAVIAERTKHVTGLPPRLGGSGDPSPWTARGVVIAIRTTCERVFGSSSLHGRTIAVIGLGHVGGRVLTGLARAGATLLASDIDPAKRAAAKRAGARWIDPDDALFAAVDVLVPCALGGVFDHETVPALRCAAIAGAANNQLGEDGVAEMLADRGILWAPDFVVNAGGIMNVALELEGYDKAKARARVATIGDRLREVFDHAHGFGVTPLSAAMEIARRRLAETGRR